MIAAAKKIGLTNLLLFTLVVTNITVLSLYWWGESPGTWRGGTVRGADLAQHYAAGVLLNESGYRDLYHDSKLGLMKHRLFDLPSPNENFRFNYVYSPLLALLSSRCVFLEYQSFFIIWFAASICFYVSSIFLISSLFENSLTDRMPDTSSHPSMRNSPRVLLFLLAFSYAPFYYGLILGQNAALTLLIISSASFLMHLDRPFFAGIVIGCLFYKPQFLPYLGLGLLILGQWKTLAGFFLCSSAWQLITILFCGTESFIFWLNSLALMASHHQSHNHLLNVTWRGFAYSLEGKAGPFSTLASIICHLVFFLILISFRRRLSLKSSQGVILFTIVALWLVFSNYAMHYELILLLPLIYSCLIQKNPHFTLLFGLLIGFLSIDLLQLKVALIAPLLTIWMILATRQVLPLLTRQ